MGSVNYIFANTGQCVRIIIQTLDNNGFPVDLDGYGNWLDGYGYLIDGYWSDAPDGYYPDGYQDGYAGPNDGYYVPVVQRVIFPDLSLAANYPRPMMRVAVGLYMHGLQLPNGVPAIGTYVASVSWMQNGIYTWETYAINATRPFGVTSVTPI